MKCRRIDSVNVGGRCVLMVSGSSAHGFRLIGPIDRIDYVPVDAGKSDLGIAGEQIKWGVGPRFVMFAGGRRHQLSPLACEESIA